MNKKILQLALPSIVSNITVPLLGLVDVAIVGHLGAASYIGAIAVGGRGVEGEAGELSETRRHCGYRLLQSEQSGVDLSGGQ